MKTINFKTAVFGLAISAVAVTGVTLAGESAQALTLNGSLSISGGPTTQVAANSLAFGSGKVNQASLDFANLINSGVTMQSLMFSGNASSLAVGGQLSNRTLGPISALTSFINFGLVALDLNGDGDTLDDGETGNLSFDLAATNLVSTMRTGLGANDFFHAITPLQGFFQFNGSTLATGVLSASQSGTSSSFQLTAQAVPSPALLPGLLGVGATVLRKRKKENSELAKADA